MDKKIREVKEKNDKQMNQLVVLDKVRDKKIERCDKEMKKKK